MSKHGVMLDGDGIHQYWWFGNRLSLEDFNKQIWRTSMRLKDEIDAVAEGMDLGAAIKDGEKVSAKLEAIEEVLRLPLCDKCRHLIG